MSFRVLFVVFLLLPAVFAPASADDPWIDSWKQTMTSAAEAWTVSSDPETAGKLYGIALEMVLRHGPGTLRHARTLDELAYMNLMEGASGKAEALYLESIPMLEKLLGPDQPRVATSLHNLGVLYLQGGRNDEAEAPIREALRIWTAVLGPLHRDCARAYRSLSVLMRRQGRNVEADRLERLAAPHLTTPTDGPAR